jgi:hypothetical protein
MREHLRLLQKHKKLLGLGLNAKEDLLINGASQPEHRGICLHLLGKVDRTAVLRAVERIPDAAGRSRLLGGVVRFSEDQGILLQWLESLSDSASRTAAAGALSLALDRLDWEAMSPARLERLLEVLAEVFVEPHERADVVFGLLHSPSFRATFEEAVERLPKPLAAIFEPLRAAYEAIVEGSHEHPPGLVAKGTAMLLSAPDAALQARPPAVRERLLRAALDAPANNADADRAAGALLESLAHDPDAYRNLALQRIRELLSRHEDQRAAWYLRRLLGAQPNCTEAKELRLALGAPRVGRVVLGTPADWKPKPGNPQAKPERGMQIGYWLDRGVRVRIRVGGDPAKLKAEVALHRRLLVAGLAPMLGAGLDGKPWIAFADVGRPLDELLSRGPVANPFVVAADGLRILGTLALAGLQLPDARPRRFLLGGGRLVLQDLSGAFEAPEGRRDAPGGQASGWSRDVLQGVDLPASVARALARRKGGAKALLAEIEASL